ncbi:hypothetical protein [Kitasatospora sp. SolWspMP-SS2h]|uniref:hypothetical protein n=1 Tax=Kitasatospora sp. SolWspMP-SS2h TaxID=1305729 RepID=UPI001314F2EC|nr:hypothetical protein [Kitasatospora sp. SolWspMP-SS2h]
MHGGAAGGERAPCNAPAAPAGVLTAAEGAGSLLGAALTPGWPPASAPPAPWCAARWSAWRRPRWCRSPPGGPGLPLFALGNVGVGASVVVLGILTRTYRQRTVPAAPALACALTALSPVRLLSSRLSGARELTGVTV